MLKDFKLFLFRGNLLDLATAVIIGIAFGAVVNSLVEDVVTPLIAAAGGQPDFSFLTFRVGDGVVQYGNFLNALINFIAVSAAVFLLLKAATKAQRLRATTDMPSEDVPPPSDEAVLLAEIRDLLRTQRT